MTDIIMDVVGVCSALSMESVVIDQHSIRCENKEMGIIAIHPNTNKTVPISMAIGRLQALRKRMGMFQEGISFTYNQVDQDDADPFISELGMSHGRTKVLFRCADPKMIKAPKALKSPVVANVTLEKQDLLDLNKAIAVMGLAGINFSSPNGEDLVIAASDTEGDMFKINLESSVSLLDDTATVNCTFPADRLKLVTKLLEKWVDDSFEIGITDRGILVSQINGFNIYTFPDRKN